MAIKSLRIHGFRGFAESQVLELAMPTGVPGSGLTLLVGPNNSGKSSLVEAFRFIAADQTKLSLQEDERNAMSGGLVELRVDDESGTARVTMTIEPGRGPEFVRDPSGTLNLFVVLSPRRFQPTFGMRTGEGLSRLEYMRLFSHAGQRGQPTDLSGRLQRIEQNRPRFEELWNRVARPLAWHVETRQNLSAYLKARSGNSFHSSDGLGGGPISLLEIIDSLYDSNPGDAIVIDEPEQSLHPGVQRRLADLLHELAADRQVVLATHSPLFVSWRALTNGARLVRARRSGDQCLLSPLANSHASRMQSLVNNLNNPHVLGQDAAEVFFVDEPVILVEGQEDVLALQSLARQLGETIPGQFFGWGVGGANNMDFIAGILQDLGYTQVVGIVDRDKSDVAERLRSQFSDFRFIVSPTDDIRDKPARQGQPERPGLLDSKLQIKEDRREEATTLLGEIKDSLAIPS